MVSINALPTSVSVFTTITGMGAGDKLNLNATVASGRMSSTQTTFGAAVTGGATLADMIDMAAAGNGSTITIFTWFQYGGDTYIVHDNSAGATFVDGTDTLVKLKGMIDLSAATINVATVITF
jgi:S-layer protein